MKLFTFLTYCTAALAGVVLMVTENNTDVQVRGVDEVTETAYQPSLAKLLSHDPKSAYEEARRAAGHSLYRGTYYYFMNCNMLEPGEEIHPATRKAQWLLNNYNCFHAGLVVGKTSWIGREYKATYIHIKSLIDTADIF
ncbi:hypothetical protein LY78DRAFT_709344 [Colletotrichum sublineola]|nr:hypothetical protein LY78DRAFT_709344 [Colletotrichum sublineola]